MKYAEYGMPLIRAGSISKNVFEHFRHFDDPMFAPHPSIRIARRKPSYKGIRRGGRKYRPMSLVALGSAPPHEGGACTQRLPAFLSRSILAQYSSKSLSSVPTCFRMSSASCRSDPILATFLSVHV